MCYILYIRCYSIYNMLCSTSYIVILYITYVMYYTYIM